MNRKFVKRGGRGRGAFRGSGGRGRGAFDGSGERQAKKGYLPEELMIHYRRVQESLSQFEDEENVAHLDHSTKREFLNNVVSSLAEELIQVSQNQTVSTIVETIIASASPANLRTLYVSAVSDLSITFLDRFASHVLEALVLRLPEFFEQSTHSVPDDEEDDVPQDKFVESFESMCDFVDSQFEVLMTHMYGSHVLRAFLEALSGVTVAHELKKTQKSGYGSCSRKADSPQQTQKQKPPGTFKALFDKYSKRVFRVCDYEVHLKDPLSSLLLQAVLMILHQVDPDLCQKHCQTILQRVAQSCSQAEDPTESIPDMAQDTAGSHLLEVIFKLSSNDLMRQAYESLLQGKLLYYAIHVAANHVLQTFLSSLRDKDLMEKMFEELSKHLEDILAVGYFGLVVSLAEGCRRLCVKQDDFISTLMEAFHCNEPERQKLLMKLIASFTTYEVFFSLEEGKDKPTEDAEMPLLKGPINMHGSRLIQELLQFHKPTHAALGLLDFQPSEIQLLCCDPAGSHVVDVYFASSTVLEKNRDIFLRKLKGVLVDVACTRNGSRCLEGIWKNLNLTQRTALAKELAVSERIRNDRFGHFLYHSCQLGLFTGNRKRWQEQQGALAKRKKIMRELLHKTISEPATKKRKLEEHGDSAQKDDHIEDSITAMFIKQKKQKDAERLASAQLLQAHSDNEDGSASPTPLSPASAERSTEGKKKKKKKNKGKASPVKSSDFERSELEVSVESRKKLKKRHSQQQEETDSKEKVKKKKKVKKLKSRGDE